MTSRAELLFNEILSMANTVATADGSLNFNDELYFTILIFSVRIIYSVAMAMILLKLAIATVVAIGNYRDTVEHRSKK